MKQIIAVIGLSFSLVFGASYQANEFRESNFYDDTIALTYKKGLADTAYIGLTRPHTFGADLFAWKSYFWRVVKGDGNLNATDVDINVSEMDYNPLTGETVYNVLADTSADSISTTGVAADTSWNKKAFSANICNGYRVICSGGSGGDATNTSTLLFWWHFIKSLRTSK